MRSGNQKLKDQTTGKVRPGSACRPVCGALIAEWARLRCAEDDSAFFAGLPAARAPAAPKKRRERQAAVRSENPSHALQRQEPPQQVSGTAGARRAVPEEPVADAIRKEYKLRCASAASTVPCCQASPDCLGQYAAIADPSRSVILVNVKVCACHESFPVLPALRRPGMSHTRRVEPAGPRRSAAAALEVQPLRSPAHSAPSRNRLLPSDPGAKAACAL